MTRILIADDEADILRMVKFRLTNSGYNVLEASNGGTALELVIQEQPDLVLLDVMMPVMDGFQVLRQLQENIRTRQIPVIMLTAKGQERDVVTGLQYGAVDYVTKPFSFPELEARIKIALSRARAA